MIDEDNTTAPVSVFRLDDKGNRVREDDVVTREHQLHVTVDGAEWRSFTCSPEALLELAVGALLTGGRIAAAADIDDYEFNADRSLLCIQLRPGIAPRREAALPAEAPPEDEIWWLERAFRADDALHRLTGASHGAAMGSDGVYFLASDIGRHNAMDKAVGAAVLGGMEPGRCGLYTSGRAPEDIVRKAVLAGVPLLCSRKAPTDRGVALARRYGVRLFCYVRDGRCNCYCEGES